MARNEYHAQLRTLPAFRNASDAALTHIARLVDTVELPAGMALAASDREMVLTLEPTHVVVIDRRALAAIEELVDDRAITGRCGTPR